MAREFFKTPTLVWDCSYHIIWCTKYRKPVLHDEIADRLKQLIIQQTDSYDYQVDAIEVMPDHVHLIATINPQLAPTVVVGKIKGFTANKLRAEFPELKRLLQPSLWTRSKFISSTGGVTLDILKRYVESQKDAE